MSGTPTFARNVCAAKSFAAGGTSGDCRMMLQVVQASDYEEGGHDESETGGMSSQTRKVITEC